jgi:ferredoxin-NADP reductase
MVFARNDGRAVIVEALRVECDQVLALTLVGADGNDLPEWTAGSHIDVELPNGCTRQYSICGDPSDLHRYRIAVRHEELSRGGSEYFHRFIHVGSNLMMWGPRNNFPLIEEQHNIFIAGGIGITPILAMVRACRSPWELYYAGRSRCSMAFLSELSAFSSRVHIFAADEGQRIPLTDVLVSPDEFTAVYCCGPASLIDAVESHLESRPSCSLHVERFRPRTREFEENREFEILCTKSQRLVTVPADLTALEALQGAGMPLVGACLEGTCGTCEVRVLDGEPEHRDEISELDFSELSDRMYVCVSRSKSPRLVVDL